MAFNHTAQGSNYDNKENFLSAKLDKLTVKATNNKEQEDKIEYTDGSEYVGQISNGIRNGKGKYYNARKILIYQGNWEDDLPNGQGRMILENDLLYVGHFVKVVKNREVFNTIHL